jgi:thiol-disulfide isomerase/thioredoxin
MIGERMLIVVLVAAGVAVAWGVLRLWRARRVESLAAETPLADLLPTGRPAVVAFAAPGCAECKARQAPALDRLAATLGDAVTVRTLAAPDHPELVGRLGILTVPSTVVLDARGTVRHLNLGFAATERLAEQIRAVGLGHAPAA